MHLLKLYLVKHHHHQNLSGYRLGIIRNKAITAQDHYDALRKHYYDKNANDFKYEVGQDVMYNISSRLTGNKRKLKPNWIGPYEIITVFNNGLNYKLCDKSNNNTFNVHRTHIKLFIANKFVLINTSPTDFLNNYLSSDLYSLKQTNKDIQLVLDYVDEIPVNNNVNDEEYFNVSYDLLNISHYSRNLINTTNEQYQFINNYIHD
eukprot:406062_1